jgi:effector-binding domain-containing protein
VATQVVGDDRVLAGAMPAGDYVVADHVGHPDSIAESHLALVAWAEEQGITLSKDGEVWETMFESYRTDPEDEPDLGRWRTELVYLTR